MKLGYVNVDGMLQLFTAKQFAGWWAYAQLEPFGERWEDFRFASIVQAIRNFLVTKEEHLSSIDDCVLKVKDEPTIESKPKTLSERVVAVAQTVEEQIMIARIMAEIQAQLQRENSPDK